MSPGQSPLIRYTDSVALMPPAYFGSVGYYAVMAAHSSAAIDLAMRYDKRKKSVHRMSIVDTHHEVMLTVPVTKPERTPGAGALLWSDVRVSGHGQWWAVHRVSLESAYGRTPFFEFYIDRLLPLLAPRQRDASLNEPVTELDMKADIAVRQILGLDTDVTYIMPENDFIGVNIKDYRRHDFESMAAVDMVEYYQIRGKSLGFISNLSILDLIFNCGPEAPLVLKKIINNL